MIAPGTRRIFRCAILFLGVFALLAWPFAFVGRDYRHVVAGGISGPILSASDTSATVQLVPNRQPGFE